MTVVEAGISVCVVEEIKEEVDVGKPVDIFHVGHEVYTRKTDPFAEARVAEVVRLVKVGDDLTTVQREEVKALVAEFADGGREILN